MTKTCPTHDVALNKNHTRFGPLWTCPIPGCTVKCWDGHTSTPADDETRALRERLHALFDPLWRPGPSRRFKGPRKGGPRSHAYRWLARKMGLIAGETHIGMFDAEQCRRAIEIVEAEWYELKR